MTHSLSLRAAAAALALAVPLALSVAVPARAQQSKPAEDPVVATVNGENVVLSDLQALHADLPEQVRKLSFERIYRPLLEQVIQTKLLAAKARADGLDKTPGVARRLRTLQDRMLHRVYLSELVEKSVTEDQLAAAYKDFAANHSGKEEIKARHILVKTKKAAMAVIEALDKGGKFARLAEEKSIGPSKAGGGDLGWFARGQMVKPFADAAFGLKKGAFTEAPVQTQFGWHVILLEDRRRMAPPPFDEKRVELRQQLESKLMAAEIERLGKAAKIVRFGPDGKPLDDGAPTRKEDKKQE